MKPLKLTLQGFNSYETKQEVDFDKLMEYGMFGIFGKTGSGKSSIIDGIIVALYGNVQNKKSRVGFINSNCSEAIITFEFVVYKNGKEETYQVHRLFKKTNDDGIIAKNAVLRKLNNGELEPVVEKTEAVNREIINIIGLGYDDFTRTVVLPQGAFAEFLHISGKDKGLMLERVFGLENYGDKLVKSARELAKNVKEENEFIEMKLKSLSNINIDEDAEIKLVEVNKQYEQYSKEKKELKEKYEEVKKIFDEVHEYNQNVDKFNELEKNKDRIQEIEKFITKYEVKLKVAPIITYIEKANIKLKEDSEKLLEYEKQYETEKENYTAYEQQYKQQQIQYEENMALLIEKQETLNLIGETVKKIENVKIEIQRIEVEMQKLETSEKEEISKINELTLKVNEIKDNIIKTKKQNENLEIKYSKEIQQLITKNKEIQLLVNENKKVIQKNKEEINSKEEQIKKHEIQKEKFVNLIEIKNKQIIDTKPMFIDVFGEVSQNVIELKVKDVNTEYFNNKIQVVINANQLIEEKETLLKHVQNMNIAAILAKTLEDNEPCPVCGSKSHPNIANDIQEEMKSNVEIEIEQQKKLVERTKKEMYAELEKIKSINKTYEEDKRFLTEEIEKIKSEENIVNNNILVINGSIDQLRKNIEENKNKLEKIEAQIDANVDYVEQYDEMVKCIEIIKENNYLLQKYSEEKEMYDNKVKVVTSIINDVQLNIAKLNTEKNAYENQEKERTNEIQQKLKGKSVEEIQNIINKRREIEKNNLKEKEERYVKSQETINKLDKYVQEIKLNNDNIIKNIYEKDEELNRIADKLVIDSVLEEDTSVDEYVKYKEEVKVFGQSMFEVKKYIENYEYKDKDYNEEKLGIECKETQSKLEEIDVLVETVVNEKGRLEENVKIINENKKEIDALKSQQEECLKKLKSYEKLESTLSGGRKKISFLDYISRKHLQFITNEASKRLRNITNNRYSIEVKDDNIDFVIIDYNKGGSRRMPKTLSGGETFLVSLCLALALSKQVQFKKSSVLEFFFLDEGFGTLDSELLTVVVSALGSLKDERLNIGIISHVEELKENMPRKLIVSETVDGSRLEVM